MSLNEKIMKTAMNSAMSSFNEQIPMFTLIFIIN